MAKDKEGDISFTFNAEGFKDFVNKVDQGFTNLTNVTKKSSEKMGGAMTGAVTKGNLYAQAIGKVLGSAFNVLKENLPELGATMGIAKDIFFRNLLFPLRKEILPLLNKFLDWVKNHRKTFVEMGNVLANAFHMVKSVVTSVFNIIKPILQVVGAFVKSVFGDSVKSIGDAINLVMFKISATMIFLETLLAPYIEGLKNMIGGVLSAIMGLLGGLFKGFTKNFDVTKDFSALIGDLGRFFTEMGEALKFLVPALSFLGEVLGTQLAVALKFNIMLLRDFLAVIHAIFDLVKGGKFGDVMKDLGDMIAKNALEFKDQAVKAYSGLGPAWNDMIKKYGDMGNKKQPTDVHDAIITKDGKVIKTDPADHILATKDLAGLGRGPGRGGEIKVNLSFGDLNISVTEGNAENAGQNVIKGIGSQIRYELMNNLLVEGGRP